MSFFELPQYCLSVLWLIIALCLFGKDTRLYTSIILLNNGMWIKFCNYYGTVDKMERVGYKADLSGFATIFIS